MKCAIPFKYICSIYDRSLSYFVVSYDAALSTEDQKSKNEKESQILLKASHQVPVHL